MESAMSKLGEEQIPPNHRIMARGSEEMQHCKAVRQNGCSEHLGYSNFCLSFRVGKKKGHLLPGWWVRLGLLSIRERATNVWPVGAGGTSAQPPELHSARNAGYSRTSPETHSGMFQRLASLLPADSLRKVDRMSRIMWPVLIHSHLNDWSFAQILQGILIHRLGCLTLASDLHFICFPVLFVSFHL